ncbi:two-component sensor histidine kinase [Pullulanibacillus camelliae]|uniref:histidine kinase n=1 Tax=Pullulanibacillus camelliae TaxID=1707096 RepID=A0A8J2YB70_9BACL|nr:ATP-binding protein [Pullulanibacillus camelliae]GGE31863.1 two-component sensor histidine kinase [Pullulanibacillus camelliae]
MRLRTQLIAVNGISFAFIFVILMFSYTQMVFFNGEAILILLLVTVGAGMVSFFTHYFLTRPIQQAIQRISLQSKAIAAGEFDGRVPVIGPMEFQELANNFNEMNHNLQESFQKLHQSEASRKDLVANISHDLRTPLTSIQSFVEALQDHVIEDEETLRKYLKTIQLETQRISHLINDLFQLSQLDSGIYQHHPEPYHLDNLIVETLETLTFQIEKNKINIIVDMPNQIPAVFIDPYKIKQVLINLIQNALRYSRIGSTIKIKIEKLEKASVKVTLIDEGEGIPEKDLSSVFNRFYRVEKSRNRGHGGAGLGLSIAKSIVERHGGAIGVDSKLGEGSSFWFTLPKYQS